MEQLPALTRLLSSAWTSPGEEGLTCPIKYIKSVKTFLHNAFIDCGANVYLVIRQSLLSKSQTVWKILQLPLNLPRRQIGKGPCYVSVYLANPFSSELFSLSPTSALMNFMLALEVQYHKTNLYQTLFFKQLMTVLENTMISDFTVMERAFFLNGREATDHAVYRPVIGITYNYPKQSFPNAPIDSPYQDIQAQDRAHFISHKNPIVYQLVTKGTAEQILPEKADAKLRLECLVIRKGNFKSLLNSETSAWHA
ncbi:hypothetical protein N7488_002801 [Penicillium malachiteum]|nr:hypothetical protein N7488_002801 [Penicillium malachiteum]